MMKKHTRNILIILGISILITIIFSNIIGDQNWVLNGIILNIIYGLIIGLSISFSGVIAKLIISKSNIKKNPTQTYVILMISVFLFITIGVVIVNTFWFHFTHGYEYSDMYRSAGFIIITVITIFIGLTIFFIILSNNYMKSFIKAEKETEQAMKEVNHAKYETLKSQINPHFLFNSLNTLSSLIRIDVSKADDFTNKLSGIYRYILDHQDDELVTLKEEIEFVKKFASLQSIRFNENFSLAIDDFNESKNNLIIPFSLQILLENIFKHNIISDNQKIRTKIVVEDDYVVVSNNKTKKKNPEVSHNIGLKNIINRYEFICDVRCIIEDTSDKFTVKLPLITEE